MATSTTKLGLIKPDFVDVVDITDLNSNADDIDAAVGSTIVTSSTRPGSPWAGQVIYETDTEDSFVWTGSEWKPAGGGGGVTVATTAPSDPDEGDLWLDSTEAKMYVYYDDGDSAQWVAAVGGTVPQQGKILQVVRATDSTQRSTTSTSFTDVTGMSITITPTSATSTILLMATFRISLSRASAGDQRSNVQWTDSSDVAISGAEDALFGDKQANDRWATNGVVVGYASPATTSATTYKLRFKTTSGTTFQFANDSSTGQLLALEVAA